jgi:hypothetical protein
MWFLFVHDPAPVLLVYWIWTFFVSTLSGQDQVTPHPALIIPEEDSQRERGSRPDKKAVSIGVREKIALHPYSRFSYRNYKANVIFSSLKLAYYF